MGGSVKPSLAMGRFDSETTIAKASGLDAATRRIGSLKKQKSKIKTAEGPRRGPDFLNFALCYLHFDMA